MLEKPKFLTGEVKEFIDEFAKCWHNTKLDYKQISFYLFETSNFYNQPFDSAMIEKYFKGWEIEGNMAKWYGYFPDGSFGASRITMENKKFTYSVFLYEVTPPKTLAHFISDCIRAGITLEWRE